MARIPDDELARLKREVDLVALVRASGVDLAPCGGDFRGLCPFHEETTPSFSVRPKGPQGWGLFHCFGCGLGGDAIRWVELTQHVPFRRSAEILLGGLAAIAPAGPTSTAPRCPSVVLSSDLSDQALLDAVVAYYRQTFVSTAEGQEYVTKRGLRSSEMVERFQLGYANRTLAYRLPKVSSHEGQALRARLAGLGVLRETGHEAMAGSVVLPIFDGQGRACGLYGRKTSPSLKEGTPLHLYLKGPHRGVWNVEAFSATREIILTEGPFDMLTFWAYGHRGVTSAFGAQGFTDEMLAAMTRHGTERVFIAYDADEAGDRAAKELAPRLSEAGIEVRRVVFPREAKDANDYARKLLASGADVSHNLGVLLRAAPLMREERRAASMGAPTLREASAPPDQRAGAQDLGEVSVAVAPAPETSSEGRGEGPEAPRAPEPPPAPAATVASFPGPQAGTPSSPEPAGEGVPSGPAKRESCEAGEDLGAASAPVVPLPEAPTVPPADGSGAAAEPLPFAASAHGGAAAPSVVVRGEEVELTIGDRAYRVRDLWKNLSLGRMEVNVRVSRGERYHVDSFDLLKARPRELYTKQAAIELAVEGEVVKKDLGKLLNELEALQQRRVKKVLEPRPKNVEIPEDEKAEAFALLRDPRLLLRVVEDLSRVGLVGEETNKLLAYLAATSRKLAEPLAVLVQSNSAAGKSTLMDAVLELMPSEEVERYTAMTGQSLYYLADSDLKHKVLAIAEVEGAERAGYAIKMLQSEGKISIATTVKDPDTGEMKTKRHLVEGPVAVFLTTTEAEIDEELANRAVVLAVNEDREQTRAIHEAQRRSQTLEGILAREDRQAVVRLHRNAQRLLRPLRVVNPYAEGLTFEASRLRSRRDHMKYLTLIQAIALLHQYQRPIRQREHRGRVVPYIEATVQDIEVANRLANDAIGRSLDEMAPQTRRLLLLVEGMVSARCRERKIEREDYRFTRRELREETAWGDFQLRKHLGRLVELEHVLVHHGGRGQSFVYELVYDGQGKDGSRFVVGLIDPKRLRAGTTGTSSPSEGGYEPPLSPLRAPSERGSSTGGNGSGAVLSPP